ncbi:MAG: hypothetical protein ACTS27_01570 [Phycisphaerales bacterium]
MAQRDRDGRTQGAGLTPRQERAIACLLAEPSVAKAAESAGVGERTLHRWLREPLFAREYRAARRGAFDQAIGLTQRYGALAAQALARIVADPKSSASARVAAATAILRFGREGVELDDLASRIEDLEFAARGPGEGGAP